MDKFESTHSYKLIYVFSMPYDSHKGLLKVGEATLSTNTKPTSLLPNCHELNQAANARIKSYTATASMKYTLLHTELAIRMDGGYSFTFKDKDVHRVLMNSGVHKVQPNGATGEEWFETTPDVVQKAIAAVKEGRDTLSSSEKVSEKAGPHISFRDEQLDAIDKTIKAFKKDDEMLWYAKMRFGKTLTALEVVRRLQFRRVLILTHRPVVSDGWSTDFGKIFYEGSSEHTYSFELKTNDSAYTFDEKIDLANDLKIRMLDKDGAYFLYFASVQDLRGSALVGGKFNKNNAVFELQWDLIIIDEAHEGTQTELGDAVVKRLRKEGTKVLSLSGTPFNLLDKYSEDNVYTWDYVMEQKRKAEWDLLHYGDHNPYADLPQMHIYTYDLGDTLRKYVSDEYDTKAFNFREFFRVWSRGPHGKREIPKGAVEGAFVHEKDVLSFLNLMVKEDANSIYPFASQEYRDMFRHTLWMVPGVKEARALSKLLHEHPVFGQFGIANVAGEGDTYEQDCSQEALERVRSTIKNYTYSITLSCGKLTTGVTVPEWTAVLMLSGSYSTAAAQYMQTIFRVQSAGCIDGKQKTDCYVFDFAPDRTLRVLTDTVHLSRKPGRSEKKRREAMQEFLNFCPVIAVSGSRMSSYSVDSMMEQVKQIYAERAVNSGFDDESIYNDELLRLDSIDLSKFNALKAIIGTSKSQKKPGEVKVNEQGLTDEQIQIIGDGDEPVDTRPPLTPEELEQLRKQKEAKKDRKKAIDILRGISIRMPLLIYGADVPIDAEIGIEQFVELVDEASWEEFMPQGVTKKIFGEFTKYYDRDVFIAAGKRIRKLAAAADKETPTRRVQLIAEIFRHFKNPDKETVLTPWRVVNMHMSDTIGGWCFFNEQFEDDTAEGKYRLDEPRFVDQGEVTAKVFRDDAQILEINSKTGLYPLYVAYSAYRQKLEDTVDDDWEPEELWEFWKETLEKNVFVICKTPMAKSITRRTLAGYHKDTAVNAQYYDDLVNTLKEKSEQFKAKVLCGGYWKKEVKEMKFDAIVGNPPYQITGGSGGNNDAPIYQDFAYAADSLSPNYISFVIPSRWFAAGRENLLGEFRDYMLKNKHLQKMVAFTDSSELFTSVEIKGGLCYYLINNSFNGDCEYTLSRDGNRTTTNRDLSKFDIFIREPMFAQIVEKVQRQCPDGTRTVDSLISSDTPFGIPSNPRSSKKTPFDVFDFSSKEHDVLLFHIEESKRKVEYVRKGDITKNASAIEYDKVFIPGGYGAGETWPHQILGKPEIAPKHSVCSQSYLFAAFKSQLEAVNFVSYLKTKFFRVLVAAIKISQSAPNKVYQFVPVQDFSKSWSDKELYSKYKLNSDEIQFIEAMIKPMY